MTSEDSKVKHYFHTTAQEFDRIYSGEKIWLSRILDRTLRKDMYQRFNLTIKECGDVRGKCILDIGCGSGRYTVALAEMGAKKVVGIDFAENMLGIARQIAQKQDVSKRCEFVCADFLKYDFDDVFDISIAVGLFDYIDDPIPFLEKIKAITSQKVIATFPRKYTWRMPIRKLRLAAKACPVYFYSKKQLMPIFRKRFKECKIRKVGKIYFVSAYGVREQSFRSINSVDTLQNTTSELLREYTRDFKC